MPSDIGQYFETIAQGIGESYAHNVMSIAAILGGIAIGMYKGPIFACVCLGYVPVIIFCAFCLGGVAYKSQWVKLGANTELGGFTEESLSALKLIVSFN